MRYYGQLIDAALVVFMLFAFACRVPAADVAPVGPDAWRPSKWVKGEIILPAGHYRGSNKRIATERHCDLVVSTGTLIEQARFETDNTCLWKIEGSLFRKVDLGMGNGSRFEAKDSAFDDSGFRKAGGWYNAYWSTRWRFENCVISKQFLPDKWHVGDYSVRAVGCTFYDIKLEKIGYKDDPSNYVQGKDLRFERCRFVKCEVSESALAATIDCVFDDCQFTTQDKTDWSKAKKPIVVNAFLPAARTKPPKSYANGPLQVNFQVAAPPQQAGATLAVTRTGAGLHYPAIPETGPAVVLGDMDAPAVAKVAPQAKEPAAQAPPAAPAVAAEGSYVGRWRIQYTDNSARTYVIGARGDVLFVEENKRGQLTRSPDGTVLDLGDGRLERLVFSGTAVSVERFDSKAAFPSKPPVLSGTGTLAGELAPAPVTPAAPAAVGLSTAVRLAAAGEARYNQALSAAGQSYLRELNTALKSAMTAGDLDDANAIKAVMDQLSNGKPAGGQFKNTFANSARSRYEQSAKLAAQQYGRDLDAAQKEAMNAGNLDEANAINATRKELERR